MKNFLLLTGVLFSTVLAAAVPEFLVTGEQPVKLENMAEKELCLFYKQIYGKELKKIGENEADGKSVIFLGNTDFGALMKIYHQKAPTVPLCLELVYGTLPQALHEEYAALLSKTCRLLADWK